MMSAGLKVSLLIEVESRDFASPTGIEIINLNDRKCWESRREEFDIVIYRYFSNSARKVAASLAKKGALSLTYDQHPIGNSFYLSAQQFARGILRWLQARPIARVSPVLGASADEGLRTKDNYHFKHPGPHPAETASSGSENSSPIVRITFVGKRYVPRKRLVFALRTFRKLRALGHSAILTVVSSDGSHTGKGPPGVLAQYYDRRAESIALSMGSAVSIKRNLTHAEMLKVYEETDLFFLPSKREPFSISNIEAASFGVLSVLEKTNGSLRNMPSGSAHFLPKFSTSTTAAIFLSRLVPELNPQARAERLVNYKFWSVKGPFLSEILKHLWDAR